MAQPDNSLALVLPDVDRLALEQRMGPDALGHVGVRGQNCRLNLTVVEESIEECGLVRDRKSVV